MKSLLIRLTDGEKERILAASKNARQSMNAFVVSAALSACRMQPAGGTSIGKGGPLSLAGEAQVALEAMVATGLGRKEAAGRIAAVVEHEPSLPAGEMLRRAFQQKG